MRIFAIFGSFIWFLYILATMCYYNDYLDEYLFALGVPLLVFLIINIVALLDIDKKSLKKTAILLILLLLTNGYWAYQYIDLSITLAFTDGENYNLISTNRLLEQMIPDLAKNMEKQEVIAISEKYSDLEAFEKDGCTWIEGISMKFSQTETLESISPEWCYTFKE